MRFGVNIGIDAQADRRLLAEMAGDFVQAFELGRGFNVEAENAGFQRKFHFASRLANPGKDDFFRVGAGRQNTFQLAG